MIEKTIQSFDKTAIAFNYFKKENRNTIVIICHGFSMSKDTKIFFNLSEELFKEYDIITMDMRGHGKSGGNFSFTTKEHEDIKTVINYINKSYKYIFLMGFSLGAASSIIEVSQNKNVNGLIEVSPPASFNKIEYRFLNKNSISSGFKKFGSHLFKLKIGNIFRKKISPIDIIDKISPVPLLIIHGDKDNIIFKQHAEALYKKAKDPKQLYIFKNGLHAEDLFNSNQKEFMDLCSCWIAKITNSCN